MHWEDEDTLLRPQHILENRRLILGGMTGIDGGLVLRQRDIEPGVAPPALTSPCTRDKPPQVSVQRSTARGIFPFRHQRAPHLEDG